MERVDSGESKVDITEEELLKRYVEPYIFGETIVINGTTIDPVKIKRVKISESNTSIEPIVQEIEQKDRLDPSPYKMLRAS